MLFLLFLTIKTTHTFLATIITLRTPSPLVQPILAGIISLIAASSTRPSRIEVMTFKHLAVLEIFVAGEALFSVVIERETEVLNCNTSVLVAFDSFCAHCVKDVIVETFSEEGDNVRGVVLCYYTAPHWRS